MSLWLFGSDRPASDSDSARNLRKMYAASAAEPVERGGVRDELVPLPTRTHSLTAGLSAVVLPVA